MSDFIKNSLDAFAFPTVWLLNQPPVIGYTALGLVICAALIVCGIALAKLRLSPLWVLGMLVPIAAIPLLWILAYMQWPQKN